MFAAMQELWLHFCFEEILLAMSEYVVWFYSTNKQDGKDMLTALGDGD